MIARKVASLNVAAAVGFLFSLEEVALYMAGKYVLSGSKP